MSIDTFTDESQEKELDQASRLLKRIHQRELETMGYINGVHRDFGDDPRDFNRKKDSNENQLWYNTYILGGGN